MNGGVNALAGPGAITGATTRPTTRRTLGCATFGQRHLWPALPAPPSASATFGQRHFAGGATFGQRHFAGATAGLSPKIQKLTFKSISSSSIVMNEIFFSSFFHLSLLQPAIISSLRYTLHKRVVSMLM